MTDNEPRAGSAYSVSLEPMAGPKALTLAWVKGLITATAALVGGSEQPALGDLVVRRTSDAAVAIRTSAGDQEEAALLLEHVQGQLAELGVAAFEDAWGLDPESVGS